MADAKQNEKQKQNENEKLIQKQVRKLFWEQQPIYLLSIIQKHLYPNYQIFHRIIKLPVIDIIPLIY